MFIGEVHFLIVKVIYCLENLFYIPDDRFLSNKMYTSIGQSWRNTAHTHKTIIENERILMPSVLLHHSLVGFIRVLFHFSSSLEPSDTDTLGKITKHSIPCNTWHTKTFHTLIDKSSITFILCYSSFFHPFCHSSFLHLFCCPSFLHPFCHSSILVPSEHPQPFSSIPVPSASRQPSSTTTTTKHKRQQNIFHYIHLQKQ